MVCYPCAGSKPSRIALDLLTILFLSLDFVPNLLGLRLGPDHDLSSMLAVFRPNEGAGNSSWQFWKPDRNVLEKPRHFGET